MDEVLRVEVLMCEMVRLMVGRMDARSAEMDGGKGRTD